MPEMRILTEEGDLKIQWDKGNEKEIAVAREMFKKYKKDGWFAYRVGDSGRRGQKIDEFEEDAGKIVLIPPVVGG